MHTVNNAFRHPVSQWWIGNNVQRHWKYVEVSTVCPAGALLGDLGPLGNMRAPEFCQDASWEILRYVLTVIVQIHTVVAETHTSLSLWFNTGMSVCIQSKLSFLKRRNYNSYHHWKQQWLDTLRLLMEWYGLQQSYPTPDRDGENLPLMTLVKQKSWDFQGLLDK